MMYTMKLWALRLPCVLAIALCVLLALQLAGIVRPLIVGWGDPVKARGYAAGLAGGLYIRIAWGFKQPLATGVPYSVQYLQRFDVAGVSWNRYTMTAGRAPSDPVLANTAELRIGIGWPIVVSLLLATLWWLDSARRRRIARSGQLCAKCGYDLRATPERCPECGSLPAAAER
jgi:hypothetical protein